jgi:hypothetical protein
MQLVSEAICLWQAGLTVSSIAKELGRSKGAISGLIHRNRATAAEAMARHNSGWLTHFPPLGGWVAISGRPLSTGRFLRFSAH